MRNGNQKLLSLLLSLTMLVSLLSFGSASVSAAEVWDGTAAESFSGGGDGTRENPYKIATAAELKLFANVANSVGDQSQSERICGVLTADIVLNPGIFTTDADGNPLYNGEAISDTNKPNEWLPIGYTYDADGDGIREYLYYKGTFDGQGHTVSGLYINNPLQSYIGLFGEAYYGSDILNVGVVNSYLKGDFCVGGVCGLNLSRVTNCYNTGFVSGDYRVGGVTGQSAYTIANCYSTGTVSGNRETGGVSGFGVIPTNSYYLDTCGAGGDGTPKTAAQFASGEVTWLLNGSSASDTPKWYLKNNWPTLDKTGDIVNKVGNTYVITKVYSTEVTYSVAPGYTVTIPESVALGGNQTITVDAAALAENKQIHVALSSANGAKTGFTLQNEAGAEITYTVTKDGAPVTLGDTVLSYNPAEAAAINQTTLLFGEPTAYQYSGHYTGTVTFTVSVGDVPTT